MAPPRRWLQAAPLLIALTLGFHMCWAWLSSTPQPVANINDVGYVVSYTENMAAETVLWSELNVEPPPAARESRISFPFRFVEPVDDVVQVSWAFSEAFQGKIGACRQQSMKIELEVAFTELPQPAREAVLELAHDGHLGDFGGNPDIARGFQDEAFTVLTWEEETESTPISDNSGEERQERLAEANLTCYADLSFLWARSGAGDRLITPPAGFAAPSTSVLRGFNEVEVPSDDSYYFVRGTLEPDVSTPGVSKWSIATSSTTTTRTNYDLRTESGVSALFSSYSYQNRSQLVTLAAGVMLGGIVSVLIALVMWDGRTKGRPSSREGSGRGPDPRPRRPSRRA